MHTSATHDESESMMTAILPQHYWLPRSYYTQSLATITWARQTIIEMVEARPSVGGA
jgi:hypothetical protein